MTNSNEMEHLRAEILRHNELYYNEDNPEITDSEYDALVRKYRDMGGVLDFVGGAASSAFEKVEHKIPMQSLNDVFSIDEVKDFLEKTEKKMGANEYVVEPKIDGLSVSLEYVNGKFVRGSTRGNGIVGEDVTHNLRTIPTIPQSLKRDIEFLEVRGEVFMSRKNFAKLNNTCEENGLPTFANPRNAAAGSLRQLDANVAAERGLSFIAFNIQQCKGVELHTHWSSLQFLAECGFNIPPDASLTKSAEEIIDKIEKIGQADFGFDIDGAVVKVNSFTARTVLGATAKAPRWAVAYKYETKQAKTKLLDIVFQIGRTGVLTPNAIFEPVALSGSTISKATLHNADIIAKKNIRVGDTVIIQKAGEIIPEVVRVDFSSRDGSEIPFEMPKNCPFCGASVKKIEGEVAHYCTNSACPARLERSIIHFASRNAMNIEGLGTTLIKALVEKRFICKVSDVYRLNSMDLITYFPSIKEKSADSLINVIEISKNAGLRKLLFALGIPNVGASVAQSIAEKFGNIDAVMAATNEELQSINGVSETIILSMKKYFSENANLINDLKELGVKMSI